MLGSIFIYRILQYNSYLDYEMISAVEYLKNLDQSYEELIFLI